ncbi:hypothetical protein [Rhizobium sp. Rhizsp82]|uniref:hypothetical protein n=1 Tax=Rhizobium sp. Rhizsp82 TaxID=3243057 RepID=UPI0039B5D63B
MPSKTEKPPPIPPELAGEEVNKYGVPLSMWETFNSAQKNYCYNKLSRKKCSKAAWKRVSPERKARILAKARQWRQDNLEKRRIKEREYKLASGRNSWANMSPEQKARAYELAKARRRANIEEERRKEREYYAANVERVRVVWQRSYWRNHDKQLERLRRRSARRRSQKEITLSPGAVFRTIDKAVSKALPRFVRDDVIAAMCLACWKETCSSRTSIRRPGNSSRPITASTTTSRQCRWMRQSMAATG